MHTVRLEDSCQPLQSDIWCNDHEPLITQAVHTGSLGFMFASPVLVIVEFYLHWKPSAEKLAAEENKGRPQRP